jgi:hypothetical protein
MKNIFIVFITILTFIGHAAGQDSAPEQNLSGLVLKTEKFIIQIESLSNNFEYAYKSWEIGKCCGMPDLELKNGEVVYEGSGGSRHFNFTNGEYLYVIHYVYLGGDENVSHRLTVYKDGKEILNQAAEIIKWL